MKLRLYIAAATFFALLGARGATPAPSTDRPRLVVGIVIDQLRTDLLEYLEPEMSKGGFMAVKTGGTYFPNIVYEPAHLDQASSTAALLTGAAPRTTGLAAAQTWDNATLRFVPTLRDPSVMGNATSESYSPSALRLSSLTDELMIDGSGLSQCYAVAGDAQMAVAMASHTGTSALWIDPATGRWCSSTYYKELPQAASQRNYSRPLSQRVDTMQWKPLLPLERYPGLPAQKRYYPFRHTFPSSDRAVYEKLISSPKGNTEVTDMALELLRTQKIGNRGDCIDMLMVGYSLAPFRQVGDGDYRLELYDSYLRLDRDIERLLRAVDEAVGADNTLVFILSTGYYDDAVVIDPKYKIPSVTFSTKKAISLLNAFLTARHGQGTWVQAISGSNVWLNRTLIETRSLDLAAISAESKSFLSKMSGVESVYTSDELLSPVGAEATALSLSTDPHGTVDLVLTFTPGTLVSEDTGAQAYTYPVRYGRYNSPALIRGATAPRATTIETPTPYTSLAPTLSTLLHIRTPNGAGTPGIYISK